MILEPRRLIGQYSKAGRMALSKGISAEASQLPEYSLGGLFCDAILYCAFNEDGSN